MTKLPRISGEKVLKILCNKFGFEIIKRRGSHITLLNKTNYPPKPLEVIAHNELKIGTLQEIIANSGVGREEFLKAVND
jgi:predicted RNA binding protein YcfA (HicA-like mRNA interferase family)